ncbi:MAG: SPOR domain-containing protein [Gammaproteobacteria bacterium]|nr:SPOR domain-containing protein [Gammaproteobacteria bacterium]
MATRNRKTRVADDGAPGFVWMLFGLSIGLVVAAAVYVADRREPATLMPAQSETVSPSRSVSVEPAEDPLTAEEPHPATRFDFYDILPKFEVILPEFESQANPDREAVSISNPGSYVLQAGSFTAPADAERMRANLALLGIESRLQRVTIDDDVYHRVRIGPTSDLNELNAVRRQLWDAEIETMLIRIQN